MAIKCNECGGENANDFGEKMNFYVKDDDGGIVSLRCLCDECAREISILMIIWSNHISNILLRKNQEKQPHSCEKCGYVGRYIDFALEEKDDLKCPNCGYVKKVIAIG